MLQHKAPGVIFLLSDDSGMLDELAAALRRTGMTHIIAISGQIEVITTSQ